MERQVIRIVPAWRASFIIVESGSRCDDQIAAVELPVYILEGVAGGVGMAEDDSLDGPVLKIGRRDQCECVAHRGGVGRSGRGGVGQRPISAGLLVPTNGEFLRAAREVRQGI